MQKESIALINFNPIPKEMIYQIFYGEEEEEFPSGEDINYDVSGRLLEDNPSELLDEEPLSTSDVYSSL